MSTVQVVAENIYTLLARCLSEDATIRASAERELRAAESLPDFFASLVMITAAGDDAAETRIRWLAAVCGKNAVPRAWRHAKHTRDKSSVSDEERGYVHSVLIELIGARQPTIAVQVSEWIARISRIDFPTKWPTLVTALLVRMSSSDAAVVSHAVSTLDMVFKQLASRRLLSDRQSFKLVASTHFGAILHVFSTHIAFLEHDMLSSPSFVIVERCLKAMRRLMIDGMSSIAGVAEVETLFSMVISQPQVFLVGLNGGTEVQVRLSLLTAKMVTRTQRAHPVDFHVYLKPFLQVYCNQLLEFNAATSNERIGFQIARFLRLTVQCTDYKMTRETIDAVAAGTSVAASPAEQAGHDILSFFAKDRTHAVVSAFLSRVFVLTDSELQTWADDPETLLRDEEAAEWGDDSLRHECEELLKTLLVRDKNTVASMLLRATESVPPGQPLLLDACYRAIGKCVYDLTEHIRFEQLFQQQLTPVLAAPSTTDMGNRVLKSRAAWLSGQFVGQLSRQFRPSVYALLVPLMSFTLHDPVVALTAGKAMQMLVEDLGFYGTDFVPYLSQCLSSTFEMSGKCANIETKRDLLGFASSLVERSPVSALVPLLDPMASVLPSMWELVRGSASSAGGGSGDGSENLYRTALVLLVTAIIRKLGPQAIRCVPLKNLALRAIMFGTDTSSPSSGGVFMMDEACDLWDAVMDSSDVYCADIDQMYTRVQVLMNNDFDNLKLLYRVVEGYALLGGVTFMQKHGQVTAKMLLGSLRNLRDRGCLATCEVIDLILRLFPKDGPMLFADLMREALTSTAAGRESNVLAAAYVGLVLRSAITNAECVEGLILRGDEGSLGHLMDLGLDRIDSMYLTKRRKLAALALVGIVARHGVRSSVVQGRVPGVLNAVAQVLAELKSQGTGSGSAGQRMGASDFQNFLSRIGEEDVERVEARLGVDMPGSRRRHNLDVNDPVDLQDLTSAARDAMAVLQNEKLEHVVAATDDEVLVQLHGHLSSLSP
jgi:Importin-beta N-terminal domain